MNLYKKKKYKITNDKKGIDIIIIFSGKFLEISLIVVSERIMNNSPIIKVIILILKKSIFSFDLSINRNDIKVSVGMYKGITNLL